MGITATISYNDLIKSSDAAKKVARKLDTYADHLDSQVYNKLKQYNGSYTGNIVTAKGRTSEKIQKLRDKSQAYSNYATDLKELKSECKRTDRAVRTMVSQLTANFKEAHGIKNDKVRNMINYVLTGMKNSSKFFKMAQRTWDEWKGIKDYIRQSIKTWWNYEGGKEFVKGVAIGALEVVVAACTIIGTICTGGALVVVIAGLVAGTIALVNGIVNIANEFKARDMYNDDPATGRRRSDINTIQDYLRSSFIYGDDGTKYEYNSKLYGIANGIDVVNFVCSAITFVDSIGSALKSAYKWTTGSMANADTLRMRDILTKDNAYAFGEKIMHTLRNGKDDILTAMDSGNFGRIGEVVCNLGDDFMNNLKKGYTFKIFEEDSKISQYINHGAELTKNYVTIYKTLIDGEFSFKSVVIDVDVNILLLKNLGIAETVTYNTGENQNRLGGVLAYDISKIKIDDIKSLFTDTFDNIKDFSDIVKKLGKTSNVSSAIPKINIPTSSYVFDMSIA